MNSLNEWDKEELVDFTLKCQTESGGFGGNIGHDPHLLYTLSAVQVLAMLDALDRIDKEIVISYILFYSF